MIDPFYIYVAIGIFFTSIATWTVRSQAAKSPQKRFTLLLWYGVFDFIVWGVLLGLAFEVTYDFFSRPNWWYYPAVLLVVLLLSCLQVYKLLTNIEVDDIGKSP